MSPRAVLEFAGATVIEASVGAVTEIVVEPVTPFIVAVTDVEPWATVVTRPADPTVTVAVWKDVHETIPLISRDVPFEYVPVAVSCFVRPSATLEFAGVIAILERVAAVTVIFVEPVIEADVAVITDEPWATPETRPAAEIVAIDVLPDDHVTEEVTFAVVPSV